MDTKDTSLSAVVTVFWKTTPNLHQLLSDQSLFNTIYSNGRTIWYHFPRQINAFCLDCIFVTLPQIIKFLFALQKLDNFGAKNRRCSFLLDLGLGQSNLWDYQHYQQIVNHWSYPRICEIFSPEGRKVGNPISEWRLFGWSFGCNRRFRELLGGDRIPTRTPFSTAAPPELWISFANQSQSLPNTNKPVSKSQKIY